MKKQNVIKKLSLSFIYLSLFSLLFTLSIPFGFSECRDDICFPDEERVNEEVLKLSGIGLLEYLKFDMYLAAFYLPQTQMKTNEPLSGDISRKLVLHYKRDIKVSWMNKAAEKVIKKNPKVNFAEIEARVEKIGAAYQKVEKNDRYDLTYDAVTKETVLSLNGKKVISIPGEDFAFAYFGIWLGEYPANENLRQSLLERIE